MEPVQNNQSIIEIRTSDLEWLKTALECYTRKVPFTLIDDANLGITEGDCKSAVALIKKASDSKSFSWKTVATILTGFGLSYLGVALIGAAILDPEPTSKLGLLIGGGLVLIFTGGYSVLYALGVRVGVEVTKGGFKINPS